MEFGTRLREGGREGGRREEGGMERLVIVGDRHVYTHRGVFMYM